MDNTIFFIQTVYFNIFALFIYDLESRNYKHP